MCRPRDFGDSRNVALRLTEVLLLLLKPLTASKLSLSGGS